MAALGGLIQWIGWSGLPRTCFLVFSSVVSCTTRRMVWAPRSRAPHHAEMLRILLHKCTVEDLYRSPHANFVLQCIIENGPAFMLEPVLNQLRGGVAALCCHRCAGNTYSTKRARALERVYLRFARVHNRRARPPGTEAASLKGSSSTLRRRMATTSSTNSSQTPPTSPGADSETM